MVTGCLSSSDKARAIKTVSTAIRNCTASSSLTEPEESRSAIGAICEPRSSRSLASRLMRASSLGSVVPGCTHAAVRLRSPRLNELVPWSRSWTNSTCPSIAAATVSTMLAAFGDNSTAPLLEGPRHDTRRARRLRPIPDLMSIAPRFTQQRTCASAAKPAGTPGPARGVPYGFVGCKRQLCTDVPAASQRLQLGNLFRLRTIHCKP